jgi:hypothetical protein
MNKFLAAHGTLAGDLQKRPGKSTPPRKPKKYLGDFAAAVFALRANEKAR